MDDYHGVICWMPVQEFLDEFFSAQLACNGSPDSTTLGPTLGGSLFKEAMETPSERDIYSALTTGLGTVLRGYHFQSSAISAGKHWSADCMAYAQSDSFDAYDPLFVRPSADLGHSVILSDFGPASTEDQTRRASNGSWKFKTTEQTIRQITRSLAEVLNREHRTHVYHVVVTPLVARLLRMDRSGVIISEPISLCNDASLLFEFYERYRRSKGDMRGQDPTVRPATPNEILVAKPLLKKWVPRHCHSWPFYHFEIPNPSVGAASGDEGHAPGFRRVVGWAPLSDSDSLAGRATRPYAVYDIESQEICFMKDFWREDGAEWGKESDVLRQLNMHAVEHVPSLLAGDDLPGRYQRTISQDYASAPWRTNSSPKLAPRIHHRLLENFLPNDISTFKTPRDMLRFAHHALIAHQQAYERCKIIHRDISVNNIRIRGHEEGILADWDLAIQVKEGEVDNASNIRRTPRIGTWIFLSAALALDPWRDNDFRDDLESLYWVVLHLSLTYLPFTTKQNVAYSVLEKAIFLDQRPGMIGDTGGYHKRGMLNLDSYARELQFTDNRPLTNWFRNAARMFDQLYRYRVHRESSPTDDDILPPATVAYPTAMDDHNHFITLTTRAVRRDGWADNKTDNRPMKSSPSRLNLVPEAASDSCSLATSAAGDTNRKTNSTSSKRQRDSDDDCAPSPSKRAKLRKETTPQARGPVEGGPCQIEDGYVTFDSPLDPVRVLERPNEKLVLISTNGPRNSGENFAPHSSDQLEAVVPGGSCQPPAATTIPNEHNAEPAQTGPRRSSRLKRDTDAAKIATPDPTATIGKGSAKHKAPPPKLGVTLRSTVKNITPARTSPVKSTKPRAKPAKLQPPSKPAKAKASQACINPNEVARRTTRAATRQATLASANNQAKASTSKQNRKAIPGLRKSKRKQ